MIKVTLRNDHYPCAAILQSVCLLKLIVEGIGMINGVLCTIDFTDSSKKTLKWAAGLCKKFRCHLTILYAYRILKQKNDTVDLKKQSEEEAYNNFITLEKEVLAGKGVSYDFKTEIGFINNRVEDCIKKNKINFLVIDKGMTIRNKEPFDELIGKLQIPYVIVP